MPLRHRDALLERALPGADLLLQGYALVDASVREAVADATSRGRRLACGHGCAVCCHQPIPLTPLEFLLMRAQARFRLGAEQRVRLEHAQPDARPPGHRPCPFLLDNACTVYAVRPIACRRYLVLDVPCAPDEDCTASRPGDLLIPARAALDAALALTLPWYAAHWQEVRLPRPPAADDSHAVRAWFRAITVTAQHLAWG